MNRRSIPTHRATPARRLVRLLHALCLISGLAGCQKDFAWKNVARIDSGAPTHFFKRQNGELWGWGASAARRTAAGWEWINACALSDSAAHARASDGAVSLAFASDGVWALCGGDRLLRWAADGSHQEIPLPANESAFGLSTLETGFVMAAKGGFYAYDGAAWQRIAPNGGPGDPGSSTGPVSLPVVGHSFRSFYAAGGNQPGALLFWDGNGWNPIAFSGAAISPSDAANGALVLRAGKVYDGYYQLNGAAGVSHLPPLALAARPSAAFFSMLDDGSFLFESGWPGPSGAPHDPTGFFWRGAEGDGDLAFLGGDLVSSPELPVGRVTGWYALTDHQIVFATDTLLIEGTR